MRQEEKNQQSREKILRAAIEEFGKKGYDGASLNTLVSGNGLSKGLVYHYFENKDQLYTVCVKTCFDALTAAVSQVDTGRTSEEILRGYFEARALFFLNQPDAERIFFAVLFQPPSHLRDALADARAGFDEVNRSLFRAVLQGLSLREGISESDALDYFTFTQSVFNLRFFTESAGNAGVVEGRAYEEQARKTIDVLLYGLAGRCAV